MKATTGVALALSMGTVDAAAETDVLANGPWKRPGLAPRDRSLVTVPTVIADGQTQPNPSHLIYATTKHAVRIISEGLRQGVKPWNIRTTIISPGAVVTELTSTITD